MFIGIIDSFIKLMMEVGFFECLYFYDVIWIYGSVMVSIGVLFLM